MFGIYLDRSSEMSVTAQLSSQIRHKIERGELAKGTRLPSTRKLALEFGIARNVLIDAYEQLIAEGYLIAIPVPARLWPKGLFPWLPACAIRRRRPTWPDKRIRPIRPVKKA